MKKNFLFSLLAAVSLFFGGQAANAAVLDGADWIITPPNGGTTTTLPNDPSSKGIIISFRMEGIEVDNVDRYNVSVKYAGEPITYNEYAFNDIPEGEDPTLYNGWAFFPNEDYDGAEVRINYQVFTKPGTLEVTLKEGAFYTFDGDDSPALTYTHTFGDAGSVVEPPVDDWTVTPANGGTTNGQPKFITAPIGAIYTEFNFHLDGVEVGDPYTDKIAVKYADKAISYNKYVMSDDPDDAHGWDVIVNDESDGIIVRVRKEEFTTPGTIEIALQEGAFDTMDGDLSPAFNYTHTFTFGGGSEEPVQVVAKAFRPEANASVKSIQKVTAYFDVTKIGDNQVLCDDTKADQITMTKTGATEPIKAVSVAFDETAWMEETMPYTIVFPETTEAGEYTVTIPAGFFWAAVEMGEKPADAVTNEEITVKYTIDPNAKTGIQVYNILSPAQSPETIESLSEINIEFPEISGQILFIDEPAVTITKDDQPIGNGITCDITWNWNVGNMHTAKVYFVKDEDYYTFTEDGTYELTIPAGTITAGEDKCDEIKATFVIEGSVKSYTWTGVPANGGKIEMPTDQNSYTTFTIKINGADAVSYDEWEDPNYNPGSGNETRTIQVTYNGESVKLVGNVAAGGEANNGYSLRDNWEEPEIVFGVSNQVFTKGGVLKIVVDEGRFTVDETHPSPAINYTCTVGEIQTVKDYNVEVTSPAMSIDEEYTLDYFRDGFTIVFTDAEKVVLNTYKDYDDDDNPIYLPEQDPRLKVGGVVYYGEVTVEEVKDAAHPTFHITYPEMFDIDASLGGYLEFSIDEGTFTIDDKFESPAISQSWRLKRTKEVDTSYIFGPAGNIVNNGYGLFAMISFNIDEYISLDRTGVVVKFNDEPVTDYTLSVMNGDNKCLYFQFESGKYKNPTLTGKITVEIPAGAVKVSGVAIDAINHSWNIVLPKTFTYVVKGFASKYLAGPTYDYKNPALTTDLPLINNLAEVIIEIPDAETASVWRESYFNLRSRDYFTYGAHMPQIEPVEGAAHPTFKLIFADAPTVDRTIYELSLDYGALYVDNAHESPALEFAVIFDKNSGIDSVFGDENTTYTAVSLDGRVLFTDGTLDQVKALDKGIYIINGKKVALK